MKIIFIKICIYRTYYVRLLVTVPATDSSVPSDIAKNGEQYVERNFVNISFPKTNQCCFQPNWIKKYPWLEYSVQRDAVYCYPCRQFPTSSMSHNRDVTFTVDGFRNWPSALQTKKGFARHERSNYHISAAASWKDKIARDGQQKKITQLLSDDVLNLRRHYAKSILDIVIFLASNELAFRGHWDMDSKTEDGLFQSLFDFSWKKDETLQKAVSIIPKNATHTSPEIQNELIASAVACMRQAIVEIVNSSDYFALYVDGTKDRNGVECISIAARYIFDGKPCESVLGMELCEDLSAQGISNVIIKSLDAYKIDTDKLLSQCYDGAFVMSGELGGVQTILQEKFQRRIPYIHCFSHRLHLVVIEAVKKIDLIKIFFDQSMLVYKFFKQYKVKKIYEGTSLKKLIATRWEGHLQTTTAISDNFVEILKCLREIAEDGRSRGLDGDDIATATGIQACISKPEFVYMMVFLKDLLEILKPADKILQAREVGYVDAVPVIAAVLEKIEELRTEGKYEVLKGKAHQIILDANVQRRRNRRRSCSIDEYETARNDLIEAAYFKALDIVISEMKRRFDENDEILLALSNSIKMDLTSLRPLAVLNRIELPSKSELEVAKTYLDAQRTKDEDEESEEKTILQYLFPVRAAFPAVFKLFCAIESFPCSTTISECSFSCLARVGILGRMNMTNERLRNLSFLAFEEKQLRKISPETILRHFNDVKNRRLQIF